MIEQVIAEYVDYAISVKNDATLGHPLKSDIMAKMATSLAALVPLVATGQDQALQQQLAVEQHQQDLQMAQQKHQVDMQMQQDKHNMNLQQQAQKHQMDLALAQERAKQQQQTQNQPPQG